ncbi:hypothetical protein Lal_00043929 [Lupinus albus]|nr:hypothetical protein Lal_00043929 [Lupinus albus]
MEFEKTYVRNIISPFEYDEFYCNNFIVHFKTLASTVNKDVVPSIEHFAETYKMVAVDHFHPLKEGIIINVSFWLHLHTTK